MTTRNFDDIQDLVARGEQLEPSPAVFTAMVQSALAKRALHSTGTRTAWPMG